MPGVINQRDEKKAKAAAKRAAAKKQKVEWQGYVECYLNKNQKEELAGMDCELDYPLLPIIEELTAEGYKISLSYDTAQGTATVTLYDQNPDSEFAGYALSGRGSSIRNAWASTCYKHFLVFADGWKATSKEASDFD